MRHLHAFDLVAQFRSISNAAAEIHLSQSAVTLAVAKLEKRFACELFVRCRSGMYCTKYGDLLRERIERAFTELRRALAMLRFVGRDKRGLEATPWRVLNWTQIEAAIVLTQHRDLAGAAQGLGVTPASLTRTLHALESGLGAALFSQKVHGLEPTALGHEFIRHANLAMREIEQVEDDIDIAGGRSRGKVAIGAMPSTQSYLLPPAIARLVDRHPHLNLSVVDGSYESLIHALRAGTIDVMISAAHCRTASNDLVDECLLVDPLHVVCRAAHPLAGRAHISVNEIVSYPWITPLPGAPILQHYERLVSSSAPQGRKGSHLEIRSFVTMRAILMESDAVALLSRHQIRYELEAGQMVILPIELPTAVRMIFVTTRRNWKRSPVHTDVLDELRAIAGELATTCSSSRHIGPDIASGHSVRLPAVIADGGNVTHRGACPAKTRIDSPSSAHQ
jgi:DNA-binding transcriptional LysR family regulator